MRAALLLALWASPAQAVPPSIADPGFLDQFTATYRFRLGRPTAVQLSPDGDAVFFLRSGPRSFERALFVFDPAKGETRRLLEAADLLGGATETLSAEEKARRERLRLSARGIARYSVSHDGRHLLFPLSGRHYLYSRADGAVKPVGPEGTTDARLSPDAARLAFVKDGDVYVEQVADGAQIRLTTRPGEHVEHGLAEFVAQEEMGRFAGMWWGPDSDRLLYQRTDVSALERFHIGDPLDPAKAPHPWPYPRPGKANAVVTLSLATLGGETVPVTWDQAAFPYLAQVKWEVGAPLTLAVQDRRQTELRLLTVDLATGATRSLLSETDAAWVEIRRAVPHWLPEGGGFLWISEASGAPQLELRDAAGARVRALSGPPGGVRGLVQVDAERRLAWVSGGPNPTQQHLYRVSLDGGPAEVVTTGAGYHG